MADIWKRVWGYPRYEVNRDGLIRHRLTKKELKPYVKKGKPYVQLYVSSGGYEGKTYFTKHNLLVSHVVYETFKGSCYGKHVYHKDGDVMNNKVKNLVLSGN